MTKNTISWRVFTNGILFAVWGLLVYIMPKLTNAFAPSLDWVQFPYNVGLIFGVPVISGTFAYSLARQLNGERLKATEQGHPVETGTSVLQVLNGDTQSWASMDCGTNGWMSLFVSSLFGPCCLAFFQSPKKPSCRQPVTGQTLGVPVSGITVSSVLFRHEPKRYVTYKAFKPIETEHESVRWIHESSKNVAFGIDENGSVAGVMFHRLPSSNCLALLQNLPSLTEILFDNAFGFESRSFEREHIDMVAKIDGLVALLIFQYPFSVEACETLGSLGIRFLRLRKCGLTDIHVDHILKLANLRSVTLADNPDVSLSAMTRVLSMTQLDSLCLARSDFDDEGFNLLKQHENANILRILD